MFIANAPQSQRFVYDHEGEISARLQVPACFTVDGLAEQTEKETLVIFDPSLEFEGDIETGFRFFCEFVFNFSKSTGHSKLFACDELQLLTGTNTLVEELQRILQTGRRAGLDFIACSQQPNEIHNKIVNQMTDIVSFQHVQPLVLERMEDLGFNASALSQLKPGEYISRDIRRGRPQIFGKIILDGSI